VLVDEPQPLAVARGDGLLDERDIEVRQPVALPDGLGGRPGPVRVHAEARLGRALPDRRDQRAVAVRAELQLQVLEPGLGGRGRALAHRLGRGQPDAVAGARRPVGVVAQQRVERPVDLPGVEVVAGHVDGGPCGGVPAHDIVERGVMALEASRRLALDDGQQLREHRRRGRGRAAVVGVGRAGADALASLLVREADDDRLGGRRGPSRDAERGVEGQFDGLDRPVDDRARRVTGGSVPLAVVPGHGSTSVASSTASSSVSAPSRTGSAVGASSSSA